VISNKKNFESNKLNRSKLQVWMY